jgi:predicted N-acetyltransferase YhbS
MGSVTVARFDVAHLGAVLALCDAEGWPSFPADPQRAERIFTSPTAATLVALDDGDVIGFAFSIIDAGPLDGYLSILVVKKTRRRAGTAQLLIRQLLAVSGVERLDLLAEPGSEAFYDSFPHRRMAGYRLYPNAF